MSLQVEFEALALEELKEATDYYRCVADVAVAQAFLDEVARSLQRLCDFPDLGAVHHAPWRRWPLQRFPYVLIYVATGNALRVAVIAHQQRGPGYWRNRFKNLH